MANTYKITIRKGLKSPKYNAIFAVNRTTNGVRVDFPFGSIQGFNPPGHKATRRTRKSGLNFIVENNRKGCTKVYHMVA
jgi:hypothetical protein